MCFAASFARDITPVVVIAGGLFWTKVSGRLSAVDAFTTLSVVALISEPVAMLLLAWPMVGSLVGCMQRIQAYLLLEERTDTRAVMGTYQRSSDTQKQESECAQGTELKLLSRGVKTQGDSPIDAAAVELSDASIAAGDGGGDPILRNINILCPKSSLTIFVGPVGCGKSTLLKAILGEAKVTTGVVRIHTDRIAYCGQTPWLQNVCLRDNILGSSDFDPGWYETTIRACMLENDMRLFQDGDQTLVGSGGIQLSGGQRQRVVRLQLYRNGCWFVNSSSVGISQGCLLASSNPRAGRRV